MMRALALIAFAGTLLAFEAVGFVGTLPAAVHTLARLGVLDRAKDASMVAAFVTASARDQASPAAAQAADRGAAWLASRAGAVALRRDAMRPVLAGVLERGHVPNARLRVIRVMDASCCVVVRERRSPRIAREVRRAVERALEATTL